MPRVIEITNLSDPALDLYARLTGAQLRAKTESENGCFIAESPTVIEVALDAGCELISVLTDKKLLRTASVEKLLERLPAEVPVYAAEGSVLTGLTGFALTRGVLAAMKRPPERCADDLLASARRVAVLEGITDSTNIGALFRSAAALGIDAVLVTPTCCDPLCRRAVRVSMGTVFLVPFAKIGGDPANWCEKGMKTLQKYGFKTCAMALRDDTVAIDDPRLRGEERLAIILGTEGEGLAKSTIDACDYTVKIPMAHGVDSLNVAAAGAVAFWELSGRTSRS